MNGKTRTPRDIARSDLVALAAVSFMGGIFLMTAIPCFIKGDWLGWVYAVCAVSMLIPAFITGRRTLRKIP